MKEKFLKTVLVFNRLLTQEVQWQTNLHACKNSSELMKERIQLIKAALLAYALSKLPFSDG
jgi:hypothetical protein